MNLPQREVPNYEEKKLYVGYGEATIVAINPTKDQLMELLGIDNPEAAEKFKDPEYTGTTKDGDLYFRLSFYLKNTKTGMVDPVTFQITNKERVSKDGKPEYVNQTGNNGWAFEEKDLAPFFMNFISKESTIIAPKVYRKALDGESNFYNFIRNMYASFDFYNPELNILLDIPSLLKGNFKNTLKSLMEGRFTSKGEENSVIACYSVKIKEDIGKEYQVVSNKHFLPGYTLRALKVLNINSAKLDNLRNIAENKTRKLTNVEKFMIESMDENNGIRKNSHYIPQEIDIYDPSKNFLASSDVVASSTSDDY